MENIDIAAMLDEEIERTLKDIKEAGAGSEQAKAMMMKLDKLHGQRIKELEVNLKERQQIDAVLGKTDEMKLRNAELDLKVRQAAEDVRLKEAELAAKDAELKEAKKGRIWRTVLDILGITVPTATTAWWLYNGMKFEEEGKIYSSRTAQWIGNLGRLFRRG